MTPAAVRGRLRRARAAARGQPHPPAAASARASSRRTSSTSTSTAGVVVARHAPGFDPCRAAVRPPRPRAGRRHQPRDHPRLGTRRMTFKTLADAIFLRNHIIDLFERADVEPDAREPRRAAALRRRRRGAGRRRADGRADRVRPAPRRGRTRAWTAQDVSLPPHRGRAEGPARDGARPGRLRGRGAAAARRERADVHRPCSAIEPDAVHLPDGAQLDAATIVLAAGVAPNPLLAQLAAGEGPQGAHRHRRRRCSRKGRATSGRWATARPSPTPTASPTRSSPSTPCARRGCWRSNIVAHDQRSTRTLEPFVYQTPGHARGPGPLQRRRARDEAQAPRLPRVVGVADATT